MQGNKSVIVIRMVFALLILYAIFGLIRKTVSAPALGNGGRYTSGVIVYATSRGHFSVLKPQRQHAKRGDALVLTTPPKCLSVEINGVTRSMIRLD